MILEIGLLSAGAFVLWSLFNSGDDSRSAEAEQLWSGNIDAASQAAIAENASAFGSATAGMLGAIVMRCQDDPELCEPRGEIISQDPELGPFYAPFTADQTYYSIPDLLLLAQKLWAAGYLSEAAYVVEAARMKAGI